MAGLAIFAQFNDQLAVFTGELALHVAAQVEVATMRDALELAKLAWRQKRECIFDIGCTAGVMAELVGVVITQLQPAGRKAEGEVPGITAITPILVPCGRIGGFAEELNLHLLELAGAKGEVTWRDLVAEAFAYLGDAKRQFHAG